MTAARRAAAWTLLVAGAATVTLAAIHRSPATEMPSATVTRGTFTDALTLRGEIRPVHSIVLTAPSSGGDLQIIELAPSGTAVSPGDVVVQFDASAQQRTLDQKRSELKHADADVAKAEAEERRRVQAARADLEQRRSALERARLDLAKTEISSRIDADKLKAAVTDAEAHVKAAEQIEKGDAESAAADVLIGRQKRDKAASDVNDTEHVIAALTMRAPAAGTVSVLSNSRAGAAFSRSAPAFKRGDRAWFGAPIAELPDLRVLQMNCRLDEADRAKVDVGGAVVVRADAVPDRELRATIRGISTGAKPDFTTWPPVRNFDVVVSLIDTDPRLRIGMNATARFELDRIPDVLMLPAGAVFQNGGNTVVYVLAKNRVERRPVTVVKRGREQVAITGQVREGDRVSLTDPGEAAR